MFRSGRREGQSGRSTSCQSLTPPIDAWFGKQVAPQRFQRRAADFLAAAACDQVPPARKPMPP